jgi:glycosyltransferase involved in cell wall biosynthesis
MRGRTPVLVTDAAGNRDTVEHGVSGLIVSQEDVRALSESIVTVLSDRRLGDSLVRGALARLPGFDVRGMAAATAEVYSELLPVSS